MSSRPLSILELQSAIRWEGLRRDRFEQLGRWEEARRATALLEMHWSALQERVNG